MLQNWCQAQSQALIEASELPIKKPASPKGGAGFFFEYRNFDRQAESTDRRFVFEIYKSKKSEEFYFRLKAVNGLTILASEGYTTKQACKGGIRSVQKKRGEDRKLHREEGEKR